MKWENASFSSSRVYVRMDFSPVRIQLGQIKRCVCIGVFFRFQHMVVGPFFLVYSSNIYHLHGTVFSAESAIEYIMKYRINMLYFIMYLLLTNQIIYRLIRSRELRLMCGKQEQGYPFSPMRDLPRRKSYSIVWNTQ